MKRYLISLFAVCAFVFTSFLDMKRVGSFEKPNPQNWLNELCQSRDLDRAQKLMRLEREREGLDNWKKVKSLKVTDFVRTSDFDGLNPVDTIPWDAPLEVGQTEKIWFPVAVPKKAKLPISIQAIWSVDGKSVCTETRNIERASWHYRLRSRCKIVVEGSWKVEIATFDGSVLASRTLGQ